MILGDAALNELFDTNVIEGAERGQINPASINLRLGDTIAKPIRPTRGFLMLGDKIEYHLEKLVPNETFIITPGEFLLATTLEKVNMPATMAAFVQGRSSIGRIGLTVQNAGFVDPGFTGHITLELVNESEYPIGLPVGYPVAQLVFFDTSFVSVPYHGKYNGQVDATGSRMYMDNWRG